MKREEVLKSNKTKVETPNVFAKVDLNELTPEVGDLIGFYFYKTVTIKGQQFDDFLVLRGLRFDTSATTVGQLIDSLEPIGFAARSVLENKIKEGAMVTGTAYELVKSVNPDKKIKYYAWDLNNMNYPGSVIKTLEIKARELEEGIDTTEVIGK